MTTDLPPGWALTTLENIVDIFDSKRVPVKKSERDKRQGNVPYFGATGQAGWIDKPIFNEELLLLGEDGAPFLDPAKRKAYMIDGPAWVNNHAHVLRAISDLATNKFLKYQLDWMPYGDHVTGTTRLKLTQRAMRQLPILLPDVAEQEHIVAAIEEHFSRLDAFETSLRSSLNSVAALRLSILRTAFYVDQSLPESWEQQEIGEVADVHLGRQRSPQHHSGSQMRPYLRAANVTWGGINLDDVKEMNFDTSDFETFRLHPGDLLLNEASGSPNEVGKPAVWWGEIEDCCFQNTLLRLQARDIDPDYLYWYCYMAAMTGRFGEASRGVNIRHLGKQGLARFPIAVAPRAEQKDIVTRLQEQFQQSSECETSVRQALERARALRRSVLMRAFSGQLVLQEPGQ